MLSVLLSLLITMAQVVFCPDPGCRLLLPGHAVPGVHAVQGTPRLDDALAWIGHVAIEAAFSGVVRVGDGPAAAASNSATC